MSQSSHEKRMEVIRKKRGRIPIEATKEIVQGKNRKARRKYSSFARSRRRTKSNSNYV